MRTWLALLAWILAQNVFASLASLGARSPGGKVTIKPDNKNLKFLGRFLTLPSGERTFDHPGTEIHLHVQGATNVSVLLKVKHPTLVDLSANVSNPVGFAVNFLSVLIDGVLQTKRIELGQDTPSQTLIELVVASGLTTGAHEIKVVKSTEPQWNNKEPSPNFLTFSGFSLDMGDALPPITPIPNLRLEFLGDSITAGYCNLCQTVPSWPTGANQESFLAAWPSLVCEELNADCHTAAWSGFGMVRNIDGGSVTMPTVFRRTLATVAQQDWDFSSWIPHAVVVNLGQNDQIYPGTWPAPGGVCTGPCQPYVDTYTKLILGIAETYGKETHWFLACGPMSTSYCPLVEMVIANVAKVGIKAHFLKQEMGGSTCCGHPSADADKSIATATAAAIKQYALQEPTSSEPVPTPPKPPTTQLSTGPLPTRTLGMYLLLADDDSKWKPYGSDYDWQPALLPYQQNGANVLYLTFLNPKDMPRLPPAFIHLAKTRGSNRPGSVPASTKLIASLGGEAYSSESSAWPFLQSADAARAMGAQVAEWKAQGIDGIDLDLEQGIGDSSAAGANLIEMIKAIRSKAPDFIITLPKDGYPNCKATNELINNAWDAQTKKSKGLLDRVSIMSYSCQTSLNYLKDYANATKQWQGFPIHVDVPSEDMVVGIGGCDSASCITGLAEQVKSRSLGGMMMWFGSVIDNSTGKVAISYSPSYDASKKQDAAWAEAVKILQDDRTRLTEVIV